MELGEIYIYVLISCGWFELLKPILGIILFYQKKKGIFTMVQNYFYAINKFKIKLLKPIK